MNKDKKNKIQYNLIEWQSIEDLAKVRMFGVEKYKDPDGWKTVPVEDYIEAIIRHVMDIVIKGELIDQESGLPHASHIMCNAMFIHSLQKNC